LKIEVPRGNDRPRFESRGPRQDTRGEDRPYHPHVRPNFAPQPPVINSGPPLPPMRGPRHDDPNAGPDRSQHPLAMQFRREREESFRRNNPRRSGPRPFKKTHF